MTAEEYVTQYLQAVLFLALAGRALMAWERGRDTRARHLAIATLLFAANSLLSAVNQTVYSAPETPARWNAILGSVLIYGSIYFFLRFLVEFITVPRWVVLLLGVVTIVNLVLAVMVEPDFRFDPEVGVVPIEGVSNPIDYGTYIGYVLLYLAITFGLLFLAFLVFGLRVRGLPRFRMLCISAGFFLLFVAIGLIPRLLFGNPSQEVIGDLLVIVRYLALASAPLLLVGFAPPKGLVRRFGAPPR